jgi:hypothetical protein
MTGLSQAVTLVAAMIGLALLIGAAWALVRASNRDATLKRAREENTDYVKRLDFLEPRFKELEQQNKLLLEMHNPADQISALQMQEQVNHDRTVQLLTAQAEVLKQIESRVKTPRSGGG